MVKLSFFVIILWSSISIVFSKCKQPITTFIDERDNKVQVAALGSFQKSENNLYFVPIICLNLAKCEIVDFSKFPQRNYLKHPIWEWFDSRFFGIMSVITSKNKSFEDAISAQGIYIEQQNKLDNASPQQNNIRSSFCKDNNTKTSVLVIPTTFSSSSLFVERLSTLITFDDKFKLSFSKDAEASMDGCGCEKYLSNEYKSRRDYETTIQGKYIYKGKKLYFVERIILPNKRNFLEKEIEILQGNRCNYFVNQVINKNIEIAIYEKLSIVDGKINYMNACQNPIINIDNE